MDTSKVLTFPRIMYKLADAKTDRRKSLVVWRGVEYEALSCQSAEDVKEGFVTLANISSAKAGDPAEKNENQEVPAVRKQGRPRK